MNTYRDLLLSTANAALAGQIDDILIRRDGSLALLNAGKELMWTGFSPEAERLKGLIVRVDRTGRAVDLVAGCLPKFYNWTESETNDAGFLRALEAPGAVLTFTGKLDGSCLKPYLHPDRGVVEFSTRGMLAAQSGQGGFLDFSGLAHDLAARYYPALLDPALVSRYTFITEMIHPANRILTDYGNLEGLFVITIVDLATGEELSFPEVQSLCTHYGLTSVEQLAPPAAATFLDAVTSLRAAWRGSDLEGTVAAVRVPGTPIPYRMKIKNETYLRMLSLVRRCTMRKTREMIEGQGLYAWDAFRRALRAETPDLPEEVTARYQLLFGRWHAWNARVEAAVDEIAAAYQSHPAVDYPDQKSYALAIAEHPYRNYFFTLRRYGTETGRVQVATAMRRALADTLGDDESDEIIGV